MSIESIIIFFISEIETLLYFPVSSSIYFEYISATEPIKLWFLLFSPTRTLVWTPFCNKHETPGFKTVLFSLRVHVFILCEKNACSCGNKYP